MKEASYSSSIYKNPNSSIIAKNYNNSNTMNRTAGSQFQASSDIKVGKMSTKSKQKQQTYGRDEKIDSDLYYRVKDENEHLKVTQMELNDKITKLEVYVANIKANVIKERKLADRKVIHMEGGYDVEVDTVKMENEKLKEKVAKMNTMMQGLQSEKFGVRFGSKKLTNAKRQLDKQRDNNDRLALISHLRQELKNAQEDKRTLINELSMMKQQQQQTMQMSNMNQSQRMKNSEVGGGGFNDYGAQMSNLSGRYEKAQLQLETNTRILDLTKQSLQDYIQKYEIERDKTKELETRLELQQGSLSKVQEYNALIDDYKQRERVLEKRIEDLCENPFIRQAEERGNVVRRLQEVELSLTQTEKKLRQYEEQNRTYERENKQLKNSLDIAQIDKDKYKEEAMRNRITNEERERNAKTFEEQFKLLGQYGEVDSNFNKLLSMYKLKSDNNTWSNMNFLPEMSKEQSTDPEYLCKELEKVKIEKGILGSELEKTKSLLQLQQQINEDMKSLQDYDNKKYKAETKQFRNKIEELCKLIDIERLPKEYEVKGGQVIIHDLKDSKGVSLTSPEKLVIKDDNITEFSKDETEPEFTLNENAVDIYLGEGEFEDGLDKELGFNLENIMTFVSIDFFLHETQTSNLTGGIQPRYNLQLTFRVNVDENFINYIEGEYVQIEIYYIRDNVQAILGKGRISLKDLIEAERGPKDTQIVRNSRVVNGICSVFYAKDENLKIASLHYKMRMRSPISEELKWYHEKNKFINEISPVHNVMMNKVNQEMYTYSGGKAFEVKILITQATNLKTSGPPHRLLPYFYYKFYKDHERYSDTSSGTDPKFQDVASFTVVYDPTFHDYIEKDTVDVYIFDSSRPIEVDCEQDQVKIVENQEQSDIIGVCRVPLKGLLISDLVQGRFPIMNANNQTVGELAISIFWEELFQDKTEKEQSMPLPYETKAFEDQLLIRLANVIKSKGLNLYSAFNIFDIDKKGEISLLNFTNTVLFTLQFTTNQQEIEHLNKLIYNGKPALTKADFYKVFAVFLPHDGPADDLIGSRTNYNNTANKQEFEGTKQSMPNEIESQPKMQFSINKSQLMMDNQFEKEDELKKSQISNPGQTYIGSLSQKMQRSTMSNNTNRDLNEIYKKIKEYMTKHGLNSSVQIFKLFDQDTNLRLDKKELCKGFMKMSISLSTAELERVWISICGSLSQETFTFKQFQDFMTSCANKSNLNK